MNKKYNIFLDDVRHPNQVTWVQLPQKPYSLVRSYKEFVELITLRGLPEFVAYDHDLSDSHYGHGLNGDAIPYDQYTEKTGYDCAKWLVSYCIEKGKKHPPYVVHSMNPVGKSNIISYVESYNRICKE